MLICRLLVPLLLSWLALSTGTQAAEPLPPEQAFRFSAALVDANTIEAHWQIADDYYLYRDKIKFSAEGAQLGAPTFPAGKMKDDDNFGKVEVYRRTLTLRLPVTAARGPVALTAVSQGCWDGGICYPPQTHHLSLAMPGTTPSGSALGGPGAVAQSTPAQGAVPPKLTFATAPEPPPLAASSATEGGQPDAGDSNAIAGLLGRAGGAGGTWLILTSFFGFGLLLAFTPCMFPMIPILSGIIVQHGHALTHARAFVLSLAYVLGMAATYAAVGVAAGLSGTLLSAALQNVWVLGGFALVFVMLALSMFGLYELQLPAALQARISDTANAQGGSLPAITLMGALSALIVGPCVAAPLAGALLYIARTGDAALGGAALFIMALGMGAPLLLVGAFSRSLLPKSGPWMMGVNRFFGVLMLATALWLISPVLPVWASMLGWALLLIIPAIYLHALDPLPANTHGWQRLGKGFGVVSLLAGAAMLAGVLGGARDPLQPLGFLGNASGAQSGQATALGAVPPKVSFVRIASPAQLDAALAASSKPVLLDFYADWCVSCKEMERYTFTDPAVMTAMQGFTLLQVDVTANNADDKALLARFDLFGPPGIVFFDAHDKPLPAPRLVGYTESAAFLAALGAAQQKS